MCARQLKHVPGQSISQLSPWVCGRHLGSKLVLARLVHTDSPLLIISKHVSSGSDSLSFVFSPHVFARLLSCSLLIHGRFFNELNTFLPES